MILDNADDISVFSSPFKAGITTEGSRSILAEQPLSNFLPQSQSGAILITSRNRDVAFKLTGSYKDIIAVEQMDESHALALLKAKLGDDHNQEGAADLVQSLDYMPLAISQAAAYINRRGLRYTILGYLNDFYQSDKERAKLLEKDIGDTRRDGTASNSIMATWQISFEHICRERPSAARLLSLMSLFDRQGIPDYLLQGYEESNTKDDNDKDFGEDISTLTGYSLISSNTEGNMFEMHQLVQFSTRKWLELRGELEKWKESYVAIIDKAFPAVGYENWTRCQVLFPHVKLLVAYRLANKDFVVH